MTTHVHRVLFATPAWLWSLLCISPVMGQSLVTDPPAVRSPLTLSAINDEQSGLASFQFAGAEDPPVIFAAPEESISVTYKNAMPAHSGEVCVDGPCSNMTNLHFHGLYVSPNSPQDDVISMMSMPGQSLNYRVEIPFDQPPGLYWYHTHPHGESYQQSLDGMSGAIVIEGISRYYPDLANTSRPGERSRTSTGT